MSIALELVRSGNDKKDRDLLGPRGEILFTKRVFEHHRIRKDHQVLKNARGDEVMVYLGREAKYREHKYKYSAMFTSRSRMGMNSRFNAIDGHQYDFHIQGTTQEVLEVRRTDDMKTGPPILTIGYQPLLKQKASEPHRASVLLHEPSMLDATGQSTQLLDELIAYWFAFECYLYEIRLSQSGISYGATTLMASGPAAGVC